MLSYQYCRFWHAKSLRFPSHGKMTPRGLPWDFHMPPGTKTKGFTPVLWYKTIWIYIYIFIWYIIIFQYHFPVICHYFTAIYHNYTTITQYDLLIKSWLTSVNMGNHLWSGTPQADRRSPPLLLRLLLRQGPLQVKAISKWLTISYPSWIHDDSWVIYIYIHNIYIYM